MIVPKLKPVANWAGECVVENIDPVFQSEPTILHECGRRRRAAATPGYVRRVVHCFMLISTRVLVGAFGRETGFHLTANIPRTSTAGLTY